MMITIKCFHRYVCMVYISADSLPQNSLKQKCVRDGGWGVGGGGQRDRQTDRQTDR